jgi:hypothetical protein
MMLDVNSPLSTLKLSCDIALGEIYDSVVEGGEVIEDYPDDFTRFTILGTGAD